MIVLLVSLREKYIYIYIYIYIHQDVAHAGIIKFDSLFIFLFFIATEYV